MPLDANPLSAPAMRLASQVPWPLTSFCVQSSIWSALDTFFLPTTLASASHGMKSDWPTCADFVSRWPVSTPVSISATVTPEPLEEVGAGTSILASSHWNWSCHGSSDGDVVGGAEPAGALPRSSEDCGEAEAGPFESAKTLVTVGGASSLSANAASSEAAAIALIWCRSEMTVPPAALIAARICSVVVPAWKRTA